MNHFPQLTAEIAALPPDPPPFRGRPRGRTGPAGPHAPKRAKRIEETAVKMRDRASRTLAERTK